MSFFAGFVQGVFEGKDWREAKNDRERKRKMEDERFDWEREDRDWTGEARNRQRGEWGRTDYERSRTDAEFYRKEREREEEEASQRRVDESRRRALGLDGEDGSGREMSVMDAVPDTERPAPPSESRTAQPQRGALSIMPELGELGQGAGGRSMGESAPQGGQGASGIPFQMGERVPQRAAQAASVQQAVIAPDPALVAEGAQIAGVQPHVASQERSAPAQPQTPAHGGFSLLNNIIASPAAASTIPEGGPQRPVGQATQDAVQGRGQGYSDYTEATRGFRSDAPRRGTVEDMVAAEQAGQPRPARPQQTGRVPMLSEADAARSQRAISLMPQGRDVDTPEEAAAQAQASADRQQSLQARRDALQSRREAANTSAAMAAGVDLSQQQPAAAPTPQQQGQTAPTSARTPQQQAEQRARAAGSYSFNLGGAEMSISRANRKLTGTVADVAAEIAGRFDPSGSVSKSLQVGGEEISKRPSLSAADSLKGDAPKRAEVLATAKASAVRYQKERLEEHAQTLIREGASLKEVQDWREFARSEVAQKATEKLFETLSYMNANDEARALQGILDVYNMPGYYEDGLSALSEGTAFQYDAQGNISGLIATFRDEATGDVFQQTINGPRDRILTMFVGGLMPEATFAAAMEMVGGLKPQQTETPMPDITHSDWRSYLDQARKSLENERSLEGIETAPSQAEVEQRAREIIARLPNARNIQRDAAQGDVPLMQ